MHSGAGQPSPDSSMTGVSNSQTTQSNAPSAPLRSLSHCATPLQVSVNIGSMSSSATRHGRPFRAIAALTLSLAKSIVRIWKGAPPHHLFRPQRAGLDQSPDHMAAYTRRLRRFGQSEPFAVLFRGPIGVDVAHAAHRRDTFQLTEVLRNGARALLARAVEAEVADFLDKHADLKTGDGHQRVVRHGHLPEREVITGIGPVAVRQPRVRDREATATDPGRIRFSPSILPPYMRRSKSIETLLPILYLKGISTGDFSEALAALLGKDAAGLSTSAIGRLKDGWLDDHTASQRRDLSAKRYVYIWADGIHLQTRLVDEKQCILVVIGATPKGRKELVGFTGGARKSAQDWRDLLLELKRRELGPQQSARDEIVQHSAPG